MLRDCHPDETEVKQAKNEKDCQRGNLRIALLVRQGDHLHNLAVIEQKRGFLVVARDNANHISDEFLPCAFCKSWILKTRFSIHEKRCNFVEIVTNNPPKTSLLKLSKKVFNEEMDKIGARIDEKDPIRSKNGSLFSENETCLIFNYFQSFVKKKITPTKDQILPFMTEHKMQG